MTFIAQGKSGWVFHAPVTMELICGSRKLGHTIEGVKIRKDARDARVATVTVTDVSTTS